MSAKCELCHKEVDFRLNECDKSGLSWHLTCFRCYICRVPLDEKSVNIRGEKKALYCSSHVIYQKGQQPTCKIYYVPRTYRVIF